MDIGMVSLLGYTRSKACRGVKKSGSNPVWISEVFLVIVNRKCKVYSTRACWESSGDILGETREQHKGRQVLLCSVLYSQYCCMATALEGVEIEGSWLITISSTARRQEAKEDKERGQKITRELSKSISKEAIPPAGLYLLKVL